MNAKTEITKPAQYLSLENKVELGAKYKVDDLKKEITYKDVEELLEIEEVFSAEKATFSDFAMKYAFLLESQESVLSYDFRLNEELNSIAISEEALISGAGYKDMQAHMRTAMTLKGLLCKDKVTRDDLIKIGASIEDPTEEDLECSRKMKDYLKRAKRYLGLMTDPTLEECRQIAEIPTMNRFSLRLSVDFAGTPYGRHLVNGMLRITKQEGFAFAFREEGLGYSFDVICDHFENNSAGYKQALSKALDTLISINLTDMSTVTSNGVIEQKIYSPYTALWLHLACELDDKVAGFCENCNKLFLAPKARANKRKYCSDKCKVQLRRKEADAKPQKPKKKAKKR